MDPISIATASVTAAKTVSQISICLYGFIKDARVVDQTLESFSREVSNLNSTLNTIEASLQSPSFKDIHSTRAGIYTKELYSSWFEAIEACRKSVEELDAALSDIRGAEIVIKSHPKGLPSSKA